MNRARSALEVAVAAATPAASRFSFVEYVDGLLTQTWGSKRSPSRAIADELADRYGQPQRNGVRVPADVLALRDLTAANAGSLAYTAVLGGSYLTALQPRSAALMLGATIINAPPSSGVAIPKGATAATTGWLSTETTSAPDAAITFGQSVGTPKILAATIKVSRNLLLQSNADAVVSEELRNAAAAALDTAIFAGTGVAGQPQGIVNAAGIGTFTGASLSQAQVRNAQRDIADSNAIRNPAAIGAVTTPTVAEVLTTRQRFTGSDRALWEGASHDGLLEGVRAISTKTAPASTVILGDWSAVYVTQWGGGLVLEADPFTDFKSGAVTFRVLLPVDVVIAFPAAFSVATSVT